MRASDRETVLRKAIAAVRGCAETMEAKAIRLLQALATLPMSEELRTAVMALVTEMRESASRVTVELASMQTDPDACAREVATAKIERLRQLNGTMTNALLGTYSGVGELEPSEKPDPQFEGIFTAVMDMVSVVLPGLKKSQSAIEQIEPTMPETPRRVPAPPVRVAADGSVVILQVGAEGGDVTLIGRAKGDAGSWRFARVTDDQTEALFGESGVGLEAPPALTPGDWVESWDEALRLMDRYRWARLHPLAVHPAFVGRVRAAVEERLAKVKSVSAERARGKWERLFKQAEVGRT